jgi:methylthioribose-1-phosphate isomerase
MNNTPIKPTDLGIELSADAAIHWAKGRLYLLDQRLLPDQALYLPLDTAMATAQAISDMVVRGAPAIGITAAYGVVLAARQRHAAQGGHWRQGLDEDLHLLARARPTAVNLRWAIERMGSLIKRLGEDEPDPGEVLLAEARAIHQEDVQANRRMGRFGADLIRRKTAVITHCNAGALATGGYGTALGVVRSLFAHGLLEQVYADETRPWLQGARLTAWELVQDGIPVSLMVEGAAAARMRAGGIGWVIVGADRIAANGDVANKIGTYGLAIAARHHGVKVMVVAPTSTIDLQATNGSMIPIEERTPEEILNCCNRRVAPAAATAWNPVFDVTQAALIDALVTERGIILNPDTEKIARLMQGL